ncbi:hypothetical protein [Chishuiella sp.]|uniref:hypothetical protein n=1 Tax=Chishuiella sp. TaxID=1969467 RepID=UPI0028ABAC91|nr:hypothetical protein [Chishuiella sp.]
MKINFLHIFFTHTRLLIVLLVLVVINCKSQESTVKYSNYVGDIEYNSKTDNKNFMLCSTSHINQYFYGGKGLQYKGEKFELDNFFFSLYENKNITNESGLIRIQFIVNCYGETDRFRIISMDFDYKEKEFDKRITSQLLSITKNLKGWIPKKNIDYYQYLIFKIVNGNLIEIMP